MPSLVDHLDFDTAETADAWVFRVRLKPGANERALAVELLARRIAEHLCAVSESAFVRWTARLDGGPPHDAATRSEIEAYLLADFTPATDPDGTRLGGAVVEHVWAAIADAFEGGWGVPIHIEHDHFSVIDHGPDGLAVYEDGPSDLRFRLWESKRHGSATSSVTSTITGAARQLKRHGAEYLARVSKPLQTHPDQRVQLLAGRIVKRWTTQDPSSAVGVSVGRSAQTSIPNRPFLGMRRHFPFTEAARREGAIIDIEALDDFAAEVRVILMRGIE